MSLVLALAARDTRLRWCALGSAALFLGCLRTPHAPGPPTPHQLSYYNGRHATVNGEIVAEPDIRDTGANFVVAANSISVGSRVIPVDGRLQLHASRGQALDYGTKVQLSGLLQTPRNSPAFNYRDYLAGKGIQTQVSFPRIVDLGPGQSDYLGWIVSLRQLLERGINQSLPEPEAALLIAITLGAHSASLGSLAPLLVSTGLIHVIAISGIKVAMVAGTIWTLLMMTRRRTLALVVSLACLAGYVLLTGATASGERSALMWSLVFVAAYLGRGTVALVSLGFVAAVMAGIDPLLPWDVGFQLSTIGTFSIVAVSGPLLRLFRWLPSPFRESLGVTLAAQLGTAPIVAAGFHSFSLVGPVANALALPLLPLTILLGFLVGVCADLPLVAAPLGGMAYGATHAIVWIARTLAKSWASESVSSPSAAATLIYYGSLAGLSWVVLRRAGWAPLGHWGSRVREVVLALILVASASTASLATSASPERMRYVGSGTSLLFQSDGRTVVLDGSPRPLAFLSALGEDLGIRVRTVDLVVVTDPRSSNVAGLLALLDHYRVLAVLDVGAEYPGRTYADWRLQLRVRRIPTYALRAGVTARVGRIRFAVLAPDAACYAPVNCAGIIRVVSTHHSFLIGIHAGQREQEDVVFRRLSLHAGALLIGDPQRSAADFRRAVGPERTWCIASVPARDAPCTVVPPGTGLDWPL